MSRISEIMRERRCSYTEAKRVAEQEAQGSFAAPSGSAFPLEAVIKEHRDMCHLLMQAVDAMRTTQQLFDLKDGHILMSRCREIERWLDAHQ